MMKISVFLARIDQTIMEMGLRAWISLSKLMIPSTNGAQEKDFLFNVNGFPSNSHGFIEEMGL